jgi:hypothetical protein
MSCGTSETRAASPSGAVGPRVVALDRDANAFTGIAWPREDHDKAVSDARAWQELFADVTTCPSCGTSVFDGECPCGESVTS